MKKTKILPFVVLGLFVIIATTVILKDANIKKHNELEDLNITSLKMIVNNTDISGTNMHGYSLYFTTDGYELDSDGYFIKSIFPDIDELEKYTTETSISIPQKLSVNSIYNLQNAYFDETGYLESLIGNTYDIELELYKDSKKIDSKVYTVLCELEF